MDAQWAKLFDGLRYSVPLLLFLTAHEFGHYIAARRHRINVSLPYYIPLPIPDVLHFGTFGAVIRIREPLRRLRQLFDVGVAGPLAGFVVAIGIVAYALLTLPPPEYLLDVSEVGHVTRSNTRSRTTGAFPVVPDPPSQNRVSFA